MVNGIRQRRLLRVYGGSSGGLLVTGVYLQKVLLLRGLADKTSLAFPAPGLAYDPPSVHPLQSVALFIKHQSNRATQSGTGNLQNHEPEYNSLRPTAAALHKKLQPRMPASTQVLVWVQMFHFQSSSLLMCLGNCSKNSPCSWTLTTTWETRKKLLEPSFVLAQFWLLWPFGE